MFMNKFIKSTFSEINRRGIKYCHFKSNNNLDDALDGIGDLDLLVAIEHVLSLSEVLTSMGFYLANETIINQNPFVYHYYGMDPETGILIHFHVYYRFVTGGSILKNHWIPIERMFLAEIHNGQSIPTPSKEADLIFFVIRKMIEQTSIVEHFLFCRDYCNVKCELSWLLDGCDRHNIDKLLRTWLPSFDPKLFHECLSAIENNSGIIRRFMLGLKVRRCFTLTVTTPFIASIVRGIVFFRAYIKGKLKFHKKERTLFPGGRLIAFVGSEASGKSTLSKQVALWFSKICNVEHVHMGKPPKTLYTFCPYVFIKCYSLIKKMWRTKNIKKKSDNHSANPNRYEPHPVVAVLDAIDRYCLAQRCVRKIMKGTIIITDRYPNYQIGGLDSARIIPKGKFTMILSRFERYFYSQIPLPDIVFKLIAPIDITLKRNSKRISPEPDNYVRFRYEKAKKIHFKNIKMVEIDTTKSFEETTVVVQRAIWTLL